MEEVETGAAQSSEGERGAWSDERRATFARGGHWEPPVRLFKAVGCV